MIFCALSTRLKAVVQVSYVLVLFLSIMKNKTSYAILKIVKLTLFNFIATNNEQRTHFEGRFCRTAFD